MTAIRTYAIALAIAVLAAPGATLAQRADPESADTQPAPAGLIINTPQGETPAANVYDASNALSPTETRNLLALSGALLVVGTLILEERALRALVQRTFPNYQGPLAAGTGAASRPAYVPGAGLGVGRNVPLQS
jgi:hypothetical protein